MPLFNHRQSALLLVAFVFLHSQIQSLAGPAAAPTADSEWLVKCWTMDDGLPSTLVAVITQSEDGYVWLGTRSGLVRFDGVRFVSSGLGVSNAVVIWPMASHMRSGLRSSGAGLPRASPSANRGSGRMFLRDDQGNLLLRENDQFKAVPRPPGSMGEAIGVRPASDAVTWVQFGPKMYGWSDGRWLATNDSLTIPDYVANGREGLPGEWWCRVGDRAGRWRNGEFQAAREANGNSEFPKSQIIPRLRGGGWLVRPTGDREWPYDLCEISPGMMVSPSLRIPWKGAVWLQDLFEDSTGALWLSSRTHGVLRRAPDGSWEAFDSHHGLSTDLAMDLLEDAEGNIWIGTDGGGLYRLTRRTFRTYGIADGLTTDNIYAVAPSRDGGIWAGAMGSRGEGLFHLLDGHATNVPNMGSYAWSVYEDASGDVWAGNYGYGLVRQHLGKPAPVPGSPGYVYALCDDGEGGLWYGGKGVGRVVDGKATAVAGVPASADISSLIRDAAGTLWIGSSSDGLHSKNGDQISHYGKAEGLLSDTVLCLHVTDGNSLWIGTDRGINCRSKDHFARLTQAEGLSPLSVSGLAEDGRGNVWIHAPNGIFRTSRRELDDFFAGKVNRVSTIQYGREDGLLTATSTVGSQSHVCQDRGGRMWFGTLNGAAVVDPATMPVNLRPPPVVIEDIIVNGKPSGRSVVASESDPAGTGPTTRFPPGSGQFEIHYTANSLTAPGKVRFRYRFEGVRPEWVEVGDRRSVTFDRLTRGDYRFQVTACNNDGVWNERGASFAFTVLPFFWETNIFQITVFVIILAVAAAIGRFVSTAPLRRRLAVAEKLAAVESERARISRDMHDELGARLTKMSVLGELVERNLEKPDDARPHLKSLSALARNTAGSLVELIWTVKPANDNVVNLANHLCQCAEDFLRETEIRCRFDIPDRLPDLPASAEVRQEVSLAVREALNNIVKHSGATEVRLSFQTFPPGFVVTLSDNGRGLDSRNSPGTPGGNGLPNMRRRLERIGGTCEFANPAGGGLVVTFTVPNRPM